MTGLPQTVKQVAVVLGHRLSFELWRRIAARATLSTGRVRPANALSRDASSQLLAANPRRPRHTPTSRTGILARRDTTRHDTSIEGQASVASA
jgi:hypothetical protein